MLTDADRFVERAFQVLFERAADAGDRARREVARGPSPDQAFEDGRVLTFYEVIRELWGLAKELGLHDRGLGAPKWRPDDVSVFAETIPRPRTGFARACSSWRAATGRRRSGSSTSTRTVR
jgi:hypothetical protein